MKEEREKPIINCCQRVGAKSTAFSCNHLEKAKTAEALTAVFLRSIFSFSGAEVFFVRFLSCNHILGRDVVVFFLAGYSVALFFAHCSISSFLTNRMTKQRLFYPGLFCHLNRRGVHVRMRRFFYDGLLFNLDDRNGASLK